MNQAFCWTINTNQWFPHTCGADRVPVGGGVRSHSTAETPVPRRCEAEAEESRCTVAAVGCGKLEAEQQTETETGIRRTPVVPAQEGSRENDVGHPAPCSGSLSTGRVPFMGAMSHGTPRLADC